MRGERERREDAQNEVDVVAEEGTHDEREYAPGRGEQQHVHWRHFVLEEGSRDDEVQRRGYFKFLRRGETRNTHDRKRIAKRKNESAYAHGGDVGRQERNGGKEVQEGGVCPEALYLSRQFPGSGTREGGGGLCS
jgi:hypothetical protein